MAVEKTVPVAAGKTVLVTGGAGYIGSHAVLQLLLAGFRTVVVDNLNNSSELAVRRVAALAGDHSRNLSFHKVREHASLPITRVNPFPLAMSCLLMLPLDLRGVTGSAVLEQGTTFSPIFILPT